MLYLSRADIEGIAEKIITAYKAAFIPERRLCYRVDVLELAQMLGVRVDFQRLTPDGSVLGITTQEEACITILGDDGEPLMYYLDGSTVLVEKLLLHPKATGRRNFTIAHELAHKILHRMYPESCGAQQRLTCDYRRCDKPRKEVSNWYEWQADALAASMLLPRDSILDYMFLFGLGEQMKVLSSRYSPNRYEAFCDMAAGLEVSRTALAYRMEQLGLLERNLLVQEAKARRGVA